MDVIVWHGTGQSVQDAMALARRQWEFTAGRLASGLRSNPHHIKILRQQPPSNPHSTASTHLYRTITTTLLLLSHRSLFHATWFPKPQHPIHPTPLYTHHGRATGRRNHHSLPPFRRHWVGGRGKGKLGTRWSLRLSPPPSPPPSHHHSRNHHQLAG